jgi:tetratricopeptide (TPR) repeat protein
MAMRQTAVRLTGALCLSLAASLAAAQGARPEADLCAVPPGAQPMLPARLMEGQGKTDMPVTTSSEEARRFFNQGVSQIHSFWFIESERSFLQAATLDPDMAMAYWGMSISAAADHRPAFQHLRDPLDGGRPSGGGDVTTPAAIKRSTSGAALVPLIRAREAIEKAMSLRDKVTPRERLYIEAEWARRNPESKTRDLDHIAGLRKLVEAYPDDLEAKSILGLALLDGFEPVTLAPRKNTLEGLALLESVVAKDDNNFGAHHYLIHGWEGSKTPERAWHACKRYPELVPNIPHALHMPGHIYAQSDRIDDAVLAFAAAAENELGYLKADVLYPNGHHGHNVHFLIQALNVDGRYNESMARVKHLMNEFKETPRDKSSSGQRGAWRQGYFSLVKTLVRFERWEQILDGATIPVYERPEQRAWRTWAIGLAHTSLGHKKEARASLAELAELLKQIESSKRPLGVAHTELQATLEARWGNKQKAWALFAKADADEAAMIYSEPPYYPRPAALGWGRWALQRRDFATAETAYRKALVREPGSGAAYFGLASALKGRGQNAPAEIALASARKAWDKADADLPQLRQAVRAEP